MADANPTTSKKLSWSDRGAPGCGKCRQKGCRTCFEKKSGIKSDPVKKTAKPAAKPPKTVTAITVGKRIRPKRAATERSRTEEPVQPVKKKKKRVVKKPNGIKITTPVKTKFPSTPTSSSSWRQMGALGCSKCRWRGCKRCFPTSPSSSILSDIDLGSAKKSEPGATVPAVLSRAILTGDTPQKPSTEKRGLATTSATAAHKKAKPATIEAAVNNAIDLFIDAAVVPSPTSAQASMTNAKKEALEEKKDASMESGGGKNKEVPVPKKEGDSSFSSKSEGVEDVLTGSDDQLTKQKEAKEATVDPPAATNQNKRVDHPAFTNQNKTGGAPATRKIEAKGESSHVNQGTIQSKAQEETTKSPQPISQNKANNVVDAHDVAKLKQDADSSTRIVGSESPAHLPDGKMAQGADQPSQNKSVTAHAKVEHKEENMTFVTSDSGNIAEGNRQESTEDAPKSVSLVAIMMGGEIPGK